MRNKFNSKVESFFQFIPTSIIIFFTVAFLSIIPLSNDEEYSQNPTISRFLVIIFENAESIAIASAIILYFKEAPDRKLAKQYDAWQVIEKSCSANISTSYARNIALQDLSKDGISMRGIEICSGADLQELNLLKTDLSEANLHGTNLSGSTLSGSNISKANLMNSKLIDAVVTKAKLIGTVLEGADLSVINLSNSNLTEANLRGANLLGANITHATFIRANLRNSCLKEANLTKADFTGADLKGSDLTGVELKGAIFSGACFEGTTGLTEKQVLYCKSGGGKFT